MCRLKGGLAYSEKQIRFLFEDQLEVVEFRPMREMIADDGLFGKQFLWTAYLKKLRPKLSTPEARLLLANYGFSQGDEFKVPCLEEGKIVLEKK